MQVLFCNPGYDYMINAIMEHQQDNTAPYWNDALFFYYKNLSKEYAYSLSAEKRKEYFYTELKRAYEDNLSVITKKVDDYQNYWNQTKNQIEAALSDAFHVDCSSIFNDIVCNITLNPVCPRY